MALVVRLKIRLKHVRPTVMRRVDVPLSISLSRLHKVIQTAMGWTDTHLYEFCFAGDIRFGVPYDDGPDPALDVRKSTLRTVLEDSGGKSFHYIYDFGDCWDHVITVEEIGSGRPGLTYPLLIAATGRCPPEDVGGPGGYQDYLEALADPGHDNHQHMLDWGGGVFDPGSVDDIAIDQAIAQLAGQWAAGRRKSSGPKTRLRRDALRGG